MKPGRLVALSEAAHTLKIGGKHPTLWLIRRLRRLKQDTGVDLLVPSSTNAKRPRFRVSLARLRRHVPELFDIEAEHEEQANQAGAAFTAVLRKIDRKLETIDDRIDTTEQRLGAIHQVVAKSTRNGNAKRASINL